MDKKGISMNTKINVILSFAKPHKWKFAVLFTCIVVTTFSGAFYPYIFGRLVDEVFYGKNMSVFLNIVLLYVVLYAFNQAMHFALNMSWAQLMTNYLFDIKEAVLKKGLSLKGEKLAEGYSGDMVSRLDGDVDQFMDFIHWNVFYAIGGILNLVLSIGFIWYFNMWIAIYTIALTPVLVYLSRAFSKIAKKYYAEAARQNGLLSAWLFEIIRGMQDVRLLNAVKHILSSYTEKTINIMRMQIKSGKVEVASERVNSGVLLAAQMLLYGISAFSIINGNLTVGGFTACITYFGKCVSTFNSLNGKVVAIAANMASLERVCEVLGEDGEEYNANTPDIAIKAGNILFRDVCFSYNDDMQILKGINLSINVGEKVSLVGRSGAGKSTIANLLCKLYSIQSGEISINNININDFNLHNLRRQIGIVHQESIFFDGSIRFNLSFQNDETDDENLWNTLKMASLFDFVKSLPNGLDTKVGFEGIQLSVGQKQRLAIARIFVKNPKILIFDEVTSALDNEAEEVIKQSWDKLCENRTILIIAHRLSTILNSDKVAVLEDGLIKGYDTHQNLLKDCQTYIELFKEQYHAAL